MRTAALSANGGGGGGENKQSSFLYVNNSTFSNNKSTELGGAINNYSAKAYILNSTFTGNVGVGAGAIRHSTEYLVNNIFAYNYTSNGSTFALNDFNGQPTTAYNCIAHGTPITDGTDCVPYSGSADGSDDSLFTGGANSQVLAADGSLDGTGTVYQPYLAKVESSITTSVPLKSGSTAIGAGIPTVFYNGGGTPVVGYYDTASSEWKELTTTGADSATLASYQVTADQNGYTRNNNTPAIGAVESTVDSLYMIKVNKASEGGTVIGGSVYGDTYAPGSQATLTAVPDAGYVFDEWQDDGGNTVSTANPYTLIVSDSVTVKPVFSALAAGSYVITYLGNGSTSGSVPASSGTVLTEATLIEDNTGVISKVGYTFDGWNTRANGSGTPYAVGSSYDGTANGSLTLYAQWTEALTTSYSVTLQTNGGTINSGDLTSYDSGTEVILPTDITKADCIFDGWYETSDFTGSAVTKISTDDTGIKTYYAKWKYCNVAGTVSGEDESKIQGADITLRGNNIDEQNTISDVNGAYSFTDIPSGEYNLIVTHDGITQTLLIEVTNGNVTSGDIIMPTGTKNSIVEITLGTPDIVVGNFDMQLTDADNEYADTSGNNVEIRLTIQKKNESEAAGAPDIQSLANGKIVDMYLDMAVTKTKTGTETSTETLSSVSSLLKIIIPYDLSGKTNVTVFRVHDGDTTSMTKQGYSTNTPDSECYMLNPSENQIIVWAKNFSTYAVAYSASSGIYSISYDSNGATIGDVPAAATVAAGTEWSSPGNPGDLEKSGYQFKGWAPTSDAMSAKSTYTINADTVFYVVWGSGSSSHSSSHSVKRNITVTSGDGGSISPGGSVAVNNGQSKTFTITADEGYYITDVLVDGKSVGAVSSYTISDVTSAHTIKAIFAKEEGLPYYLDDDGNKVFLGFASDESGTMKYIAQNGTKVHFTENPKKFTDIKGHWAKDDIDFVTQREIFNGTGKNIFEPNTGMTRAMFATVIGRLYERSYGIEQTSEIKTFTDCDYDKWYGSYVDWCSSNGIIEGVGGGLFKPDREITRQEMAAILYRFARFLQVSEAVSAGTQLDYTDANEISSWAQDAALYCQESEVITGRKGGNFVPKGTATRAEVATILERFIENTMK